MRTTTITSLALAALLATNVPTNATAQAISTPPSGDNQKSAVSQHIGVVEVKIEYGRAPFVRRLLPAERRRDRSDGERFQEFTAVHHEASFTRRRRFSSVHSSC